MHRSLGWRVLFALLGGLFVLCAGVQHNDPDPLPWMCLYGVAAVVLFPAAVGPACPPLSRVLLGLALVWACRLSPSLARLFERESLTFAMAQQDEGREEAREAAGLLLVALAAYGALRRGHPRLG
ncbi:MAG: transmembrane 220 family protein [Myxococcota bacterium]